MVQMVKSLGGFIRHRTNTNGALPTLDENFFLRETERVSDLNEPDYYYCHVSSLRFRDVKLLFTSVNSKSQPDRRTRFKVSPSTFGAAWAKQLLHKATRSWRFLLRSRPQPNPQLAILAALQIH